MRIEDTWTGDCNFCGEENLLILHVPGWADDGGPDEDVACTNCYDFHFGKDATKTQLERQEREAKLREEKRVVGEKLKAIDENTKFAYKNVGYGLVSYEPGNDFLKLTDDILFTQTFDSGGMVWSEHAQTWKFDSGLGLVTYVVLEENVPEQEKFWKDEDNENNSTE